MEPVVEPEKEVDVIFMKAGQMKWRGTNLAYCQGGADWTLP